ncbi:MAG: DUF177 domain-containing protein [Candidatus Latescibacteria bacterium]|nr:DUF177 domain-containing protein [Candidatus Latescibacterota bacterium]
MTRRRPAGIKTPSTILLLDQIEEGISRRQVEVDIAELDLGEGDFRLVGPLQVGYRFNRSAQTFQVLGQLRGRLTGECCRCLEPVEQELEASLQLLLQRQQFSGEEREAVTADEDVELLDPGAKQVDLKERLREAVLLELPVRVYCREDCKGLCPQCGHNLNSGPCACAADQADSRWAALRDLKLS